MSDRDSDKERARREYERLQRRPTYEGKRRESENTCVHGY